MDPLSVSASAAALITICVQVVRVLKNTIETLQKAKTFLLKCLSQTERVRLYLEQLRGLTKQLGGRSGILLNFNESGARETISELNVFVLDMAQRTSWVRLKVLLNQSTADRLVMRLHRHEEEISMVLLSIATDSAIRTEDEIRKMHEDVVFQATVTSPFGSNAPTQQDPNTKELGEEVPVPDQKDSDLESIPDEDPTQMADKLQIWFGDLSRAGFDEDYLASRDRVSNEAYWGKIDKLLDILRQVESKFGQSWANAPRLSFTPQKSSGWTPLHQAVFMGASHQQISRLIQQFGALRLLRTSWTDSSELPYRRMTAAEIARELGYTDLFTVLAPTIYHCVPYDVLATLQEHFHGLIRLQLHQLPQELANLRLPELVVLTELRVPLMWFPLKPAVTGSARGYMYRLDRRELLAKSFRIGDPGNIKLFRISEAGIMEIEEAIVFNT